MPDLPVFIAAPKSPDAAIPLAIDFGPAMSLSGETVSTAEVAITERATGASTTTEMLVTASVAVLDDVVSWLVQAGADNMDYLIRVTATTNIPRVPDTGTVILPVRLRPQPMVR